MEPLDCCILNAGGGSWAFSDLARSLSAALWIDVSEVPRKFNYLLLADDSAIARLPASSCFVPFSSIQVAADKRAIAQAFAKHSVPTPKTFLAESPDDAIQIVNALPESLFCLKFPTGCGASGHRMIVPEMSLPDDWPLPLVVQEFIQLERPEVYRTYAAGGELFGWVARRFPKGAAASPWVAHARGARYELAGDLPKAATRVARAALEATNLVNSFGCVDLLQRNTGEWVALEVGTDGVFNHVDRELNCEPLEREIQRRIADAFWNHFGNWRPWGENEWVPRR